VPAATDDQIQILCWLPGEATGLRARCSEMVASCVLGHTGPAVIRPLWGIGRRCWGCHRLKTASGSSNPVAYLRIFGGIDFGHTLMVFCATKMAGSAEIGCSG